MRQYRTKTGIALQVIQGGGLGDGISRAKLLVLSPDDRLMTKGELNVLEQRISEIDAALDLCHPDRDADVIANLNAELVSIIDTLNKSISA